MESVDFTPWPEEFASRYRQQGLWTSERLFDVLQRQVLLRSDAIAIVSDGEEISYRHLFEASASLALQMQQHGINEGDRVLIQLGNGSFFVKILIACLQTGVQPVLALPAHRKHEIRYLAEFSRCKAIIIPSATDSFDYRAMAKAVAKEVDSLEFVFVGDINASTVSIANTPRYLPDLKDDVLRLPKAHSDEVALYLLSGGTTGLPKLIPRTHDDYSLNIRIASALSAVDDTTRYLVALPAAHNFPLACPGLLGTLAAGGVVVMASSPSADVVFPLIGNYQVTTTAVVPAVAIRWLESDVQRWDLSSLSLLQVGGSRLPAHAARRVEPTMGCRLQQVFGMAEGLLNYTRLDATEEVICETQGMPASAADEVRIVDENGDAVADGVVGELLTRGPYTIRGYFKAPEHNARSFTKDGYYRSGDLVRRRADGNLVVEGRIKDVINRGGEKISAEEIENHCLSHPAIKNVAIIALPDPELGERVCAVAVQSEGDTSGSGEGVDLVSLRTHLINSGIATFKLPEKLLIVSDLPVTSVGKIDKNRLRQMAASVIE